MEREVTQGNDFFKTGAPSEKASLALKEEKMDKIDGDSTKSESSGEGSKSSVTSPGGNGPPSKRSRYGDDTSLAGYLNRKIIHYKIGKEFKMNFSIFFVLIGLC